MKKIELIFFFLFLSLSCIAQKPLTPEKLWELQRVSAIGITEDGKHLVYKTTIPKVKANSFSSAYYKIPIEGGQEERVKEYANLLIDKSVSPNGQFSLNVQEVKVEKVTGPDLYPDMEMSEVQIYESLDYRIWDTWNVGQYNHLILKDTTGGGKKIDLLRGEPFNCPQKPFGGDEDYVWAPDGKGLVYVSKKLSGTEAATSTNSDLYYYDIAKGHTTNLTKGNAGYDTQPAFSTSGILAWLRMEQDGYEADKNDIIISIKGSEINLTKNWDGTVNSFLWSKDETKIYFLAPVDGTIQLFEVDNIGLTKKLPSVVQITEGDFDLHQIVGIVQNKVIVSRGDMNRAAEIYSYDLKSKVWNQITKVNDAAYAEISKSKIERRVTTTTDGKNMLSWVIYPPDFDPKKKYPTLLYCQGGPQSALTQFYSFRWNFQLMAAQGYIVIAPNRRGMPGHGVEWNEAISKDWGGQVMQDYLSSIDDLMTEPYVDKARVGAVGASYGGYSVFYLAGIHENRFKSFIAHDGVFNLQSMYGTTEELFFVNYDIGGAYWDKKNAQIQKTYNDFNPVNFVQNWNTPILIIQGGKDFRVPIGQGQEAFQAAQLQGIKSKLLYFPNENHWILTPQNAIIWQKEFYKWLDETL